MAYQADTGGRMAPVDLNNNEQVAQLTAKVRRGDATRADQDTLVCLHLPLARILAKQFLGSMNTFASSEGLREELTAAAYEGVVHAVHVAGEKLTNDNLTSWVVANIFRFLRDSRDQLFKSIGPAPSARTWRRDHKKGADPLTVKRVYRSPRSLSQDTLPETRLLERLQSCAQDKVDAIILQRRLDGYKDYEIADMLGKSTSYVCLRRNALEERFRSLVEE